MMLHQFYVYTILIWEPMKNNQLWFSFSICFFCQMIVIHLIILFFRLIGIIRKASNLVSTNCSLTLYTRLIYLYISHCYIVWASTFPTALHNILFFSETFCQDCNLIRILHLLCSFISDTSDSHWYQYFSNMCFYVQDSLKWRKYSWAFQDLFYSKFTGSLLFTQSLHLHHPKFLTCRGQFFIRFRDTKPCNSFPIWQKTSLIKCFKKCSKYCLIVDL